MADPRSSPNHPLDLAPLSSRPIISGSQAAPIIEERVPEQASRESAEEAPSIIEPPVDPAVNTEPPTTSSPIVIEDEEVMGSADTQLQVDLASSADPPPSAADVAPEVMASPERVQVSVDAIANSPIRTPTLARNKEVPEPIAQTTTLRAESAPQTSAPVLMSRIPTVIRAADLSARSSTQSPDLTDLLNFNADEFDPDEGSTSGPQIELLDDVKQVLQMLRATLDHPLESLVQNAEPIRTIYNTIND